MNNQTELYLDLTDKDSWIPKNCDQIAKQLELPPDFSDCFEAFVNEIVKDAELTLFLSCLAVNFYDAYMNNREERSVNHSLRD